MMRLFALLLLLLTSPAQATVYTVTQLQTQINTQILPNSTGQINALELNSILNNIVTSMQPYGNIFSVATPLVWNGNLLSLSYPASVAAALQNGAGGPSGFALLNSSGNLPLAQGGLGLAANSSAIAALANAPNTANGYAQLNSSGYVAQAQGGLGLLPNASAVSVLQTAPNTASGYAQLNSSGYLTQAQGGLGFVPNASAASAMANAPNTSGGNLTSSGLTQYGVVYGGGSGVQPSTTTAGTAGQILFGQNSAAPSFLTPASSQSAPSSPSGTTSTTGVMMGLAGSVTPNASGRVLIIVTGTCTGTNSSYYQTISLRYGTGTAPTNGAALTGTVKQTLPNISAYGQGSAFSVIGVVTGLTPGTAYWIDLSLATSNASSTASISNPNIATIEF